MSNSIKLMPNKLYKTKRDLEDITRKSYGYILTFIGAGMSLDTIFNLTGYEEFNVYNIFVGLAISGFGLYYFIRK